MKQIGTKMAFSRSFCIYFLIVFLPHNINMTTTDSIIEEMKNEIKSLVKERNLDRNEMNRMQTEIVQLKEIQNRQEDRMKKLQRDKQEPDLSLERSLKDQMNQIIYTLRTLQRPIRHSRGRRTKRSSKRSDETYLTTLASKVERLTNEVYSIRSLEDQELPAVRKDIALHDYQLRRLLNMTDRMNIEIGRLLKKDTKTQATDNKNDDVNKLLADIRQMKARLIDLEDYQKWDEFGTQLMHNHLDKFSQNITQKIEAIKKPKKVKIDEYRSNPPATNSVETFEEGSGESENSDQLLPAGWKYDMMQEMKEIRTQINQIDTKFNRFENENNGKCERLRKELDSWVESHKNLEQKVNQLNTDESMFRLMRKEIKNLEYNLIGLQERVKELESRNHEAIEQKEELLLARSEMKSMGYQIKRAKSIAEVVKNVQVQHFTMIQDFSQEVNLVKTDLLKYGLKLTTLQADFLNSTLYLYQESQKDLRQDTQLARMDVRIEDVESSIPQVYGQLKELGHAVSTKPSYQSFKSLNGQVYDLNTKLNDQQTQLTHGNKMVTRIEGAVLRMEHLLPTDCSMNISSISAQYRSGVHLIKPLHSNRSVSIYCQITSDLSQSWTVIQRRIDPSVDFNKTWLQYEQGFGPANGSYWLGNHMIHVITATSGLRYQLQIDTWDIFGDYRWALYDRFRLANREQNYALQLGSFQAGNLTDSMSYHQGLSFSTHDRDLDASSTHCGRYDASGWWYSHCRRVNLNGNFYVGMLWYDNSTSDWIQLKRTQMKIRVA